MKYLLIILLLLPFAAKSQCNAINVNSFVLRSLGGCKYVIEINSTLTNGNASITPFYRCGSGVTVDLPNCFTWETPSTKDFISDTITCCETVFVGLRGYASSNCHGHQCIEIPLSNLALDEETIFREKPLKPKDGLEYNPVTRRLTIKGDMDNLRPRHLILYDLRGIEISRQNVKSNTVILNQQTSGIYFVVVTTARGNLIKTVIL